MFGDLNRVEIIGNITSDPEVRYTTSGTAVLTLGVATNRRYNQNDEWKEETEFHNVTFWAKKAEQIAERARKGTRLFIEGRLQTRSWEDDSGKKNYKTEIIVTNFILLDRYEKGEGSSNSSSSAPTKASAPASKEPAVQEDVNVEVISDDDLPF
ncbi:single-stranded DNA-binding protein [Candidatus Dojkabacteria bacterium]|uniref:Single-stranded DNA-binding protein n=1 Tax=Candidatus Dojkabacteria bacterium TaxID=2099670 RepID=A0A955RI52_9BACT|nr:single-stranded DNA-binding protein [Candidatus Dojkabacteria bacterium]